MRWIPCLALFAGSLLGQIKTGPDVGATVPDFSAPDQTGREWTLKSVMGPQGAVLVFYRSADW
jgi:hypothetical protein